ncbi:c-type cytochrome biogenesis protein CcmI [Aestuariivirga litoralis]|uniref:c-type cytochrome biogenesis protein CcmI n=1 Tax=Aestuariivirga litoralis TaxID=2650924 RepID=UPI0018C4DF8B|nr:c-type cytochrome biogenesis protein CcmI [Aestuariivirga litoralis]MBG1232443.1 c-type cytochrome biogenesis protein CcmI [Aestuariivirga litoralis]
MMAIWFLMVILCSFAAVLIVFPLVRSYEASVAPAQESAVYEDQLKEIGRDLESGSINEAEAKAAKGEVERRLAAAAKARPDVKPLPALWKHCALAVAAGLVIVGGVGLYSILGSPTLPSAVKTQVAQGTQPDQAAKIEEIIAKIKAQVAANPKDAEGWRMLGWALFNVQRFPDSVDAFSKAVALAPDNAEYQSMLAEAVVQAAQGTVTPKAQDLLNAVLAKNPKDVRARYYDAIGHEQSGDQQGALDRWAALLADAPADAGWREDVKGRIASLGKALGKDVSGLITATPDQQAMIEGMVAKLAGELKQNPKNLEGWMRLMQSYQVLKQSDKAKVALADGLQAFAGDAASQDQLKAAAAKLQISP